MTTEQWAKSVSKPKTQGAVQAPAPTRAQPAPVQPAQNATSTMLQRAMSGEFGDAVKNMATARSAPQEVDATTLGAGGVQVPPVTTPSVPTSAISATIAQTTQTQGGEGEMAEPSMRDQAIQNYMQMLTDGFDTTQETKDLQTEAAQAKLTLDNLNTRMTEYEKETRDAEYAMRQNPEGKLVDALQADINNFKYDRYAKKDGLADMAIAAQFALNNANFAYEIANNAVTAEKERYTTQMQGFRDLYTMLQNDMTTSEQMQYQSKLRMYETAVNDFSASKSAAMQRAQANGAPANVITAIKNAQNTDEVWANAGEYGIDPNLNLARDKHGWDIWYGKQQLAMDEKKMAFDQWLAGQQLSAKETEAKQQQFAEQLEEGKNVSGLLKQAGKTQQAVKEALSNKLGLRSATGAVKSNFLFNTLSFGQTKTAREDFESDIKLITSAEALTQLTNLGVSLSPVTNFEIQLVGSMASNLSSSVRINEETGEMTISGSTAEFERNLRALDEQLNKSIESLRNDTNLRTYLVSNDMESIDALLAD